jgi:putative inorganic carbon (hco3(-)) transporter
MSFFFFLLYIALNFVRPVELLAPDLGALRPMLWLWMLAFVTSCAEALSTRRVAATGMHFVMLGGFMLAISLSLLLRGWVGGAIGSQLHFSTSSMLFVLAALNLTNQARLLMAVKVLGASVVAMAIIGIHSYHTGWNAELLVLAQNSYNENLEPGTSLEPGTPPAQDTSGLYLWRLHALGFLQDPNDFAQAMVITLPLLLLGYRPGRTLRNLVWVALPAAVLLYAILLTHSRGALVGLGAMLFFGARKRLGTTRTLVVGAVMMAGVLATSFGGGRAFSTQESSAGDRIDAWYAGFTMFKSSPLFGIGYESFGDHHHLTAHNSFVLCFAELGLFGYFFWLAMIVTAFLGLNRARSSDAQAGRIGSMPELLAMAMVGFLTCAWFLSRTYQPTLYLLLAMCAAAWYCAVNAGAEARKAEPALAGAGARALAAARSPWNWPWFKYTLIWMFASMALVQFFVIAERVGRGG